MTLITLIPWKKLPNVLFTEPQAPSRRGSITVGL